MEKESLAQSTARDRAATSVVIDGIAIDPEECGDILGAHHFCVQIGPGCAVGGSVARCKSSCIVVLGSALGA